MPDLRKLGQRVKELYERVRHSPTLTSTYVTFDQDRIAGGDGLGADFEPGQHYFQVRINEMYLTHKREWFSTYDPVVFAATEFLYDRDTKMVPKVIGPNLLEQYQRELPDGVRYINTPVSGLHPYAGGDVVLVIILYQVQQAHYLRNLLGIVEKVVGAFDPSTALQSYLVMANVILDGLDAILGSDGTKPVVAVRHSIGAGDQFKPGYYALIDAPDTSVDRARLWIRDNRLCIGNSLEDSAPYREHDFCLFHIVQTDSREDVQKLPFFPIWRKTQGLAIKPEAWAEAKASFQALWRELLLSPDLTKTQKEELKESFRREMAHLRDGARELAKMGVVERGVVRRDVAEVSDLEAEFRNLDKMLQGLD